MTMTPVQADRAAGVLLGQASGDALGVPYEFGSTRLGHRAEMIGGGLGGYAPGEWSDDTQMAVCIARVAATGADLTSRAALDAVAEGFEDWYAAGPADVGIHTSAVLSSARRLSGSPAERLRTASAARHTATGRSAGNGALMRTAVVGLTRLHDPHATAEAARAIAELTHADPHAGDSCVLWSEYVRRAVLEGSVPWRAAIRDLIPRERQGFWLERVEEAVTGRAEVFIPNGFTVTAFQAAVAAVRTVERSGDAMGFQQALQRAVRIGDDTDTVAAIAGGLLGALLGASAVPAAWRRTLHGWPGLRARDLVRLAAQTADGGGRPGQWPEVDRMDYRGCRGASSPVAVPHPHDEGVLLGTVGDLRRVPSLDVDAVVSLCRVGAGEVPVSHVAPGDHVEVWLVDSDDPADNAHLRFVLDDAADAVRQLRLEGRRVLIHCVAGHHRTPAVAVRYAVGLGVDPSAAARSVRSTLPTTQASGLLWEAAIAGGGEDPPSVR